MYDRFRPVVRSRSHLYIRFAASVAPQSRLCYRRSFFGWYAQRILTPTAGKRKELVKVINNTCCLHRGGETKKDKWVELRKEYVGLLHSGFLYIFRMGVFLPANTSYGEQVRGGSRDNRQPALQIRSSLRLRRYEIVGVMCGTVAQLVFRVVTLSPPPPPPYPGDGAAQSKNATQWVYEP